MQEELFIREFRACMTNQLIPAFHDYATRAAKVHWQNKKQRTKGVEQCVSDEISDLITEWEDWGEAIRESLSRLAFS